MNEKKKDDVEMNTTAKKPDTDRRRKVRDSFAKAVKANNKALEKLSKN